MSNQGGSQVGEIIAACMVEGDASPVYLGKSFGFSTNNAIVRTGAGEFDLILDDYTNVDPDDVLVWTKREAVTDGQILGTIVGGNSFNTVHVSIRDGAGAPVDQNFSVQLVRRGFGG